MSHKVLNPAMNQGIPEISCQDLDKIKDKVVLVDVRRNDEFNGDLGHIKGAQLATLGPELLDYLEKLDKKSEVVLICRSGGRSTQATMAAMNYGFKSVANMAGGMMTWNQCGLKVERK